jgi:hypothetical protein
VPTEVDRIKRLKDLAHELEGLCRHARILHRALQDEMNLARANDRQATSDPPVRRRRRARRFRRSLPSRKT